MSEESVKPDFGFEPPAGYLWLQERGLIGYGASALAPWYYLEQSKVFDLSERWPQGPHRGRLLAFARRYDNDDIACFSVGEGGLKGILLAHGWTDSGYSIVATYESFWEWVKSIFDDIAELVGE
jgi:hypothetical protein